MAACNDQVKALKFVRDIDEFKSVMLEELHADGDSAMQTLGVVTGVEQIGLRKEGWEEWWTREVARRGGENRQP